MDELLSHLRFLASDPANVPARIRGTVMARMTGCCPEVLVARRANGQTLHVRVGCFVDSCTATAAAVAFWLSPPSDGKARHLPELEREHTAAPLASLASESAISELLQPALDLPDQPWLLVFSTGPHKFAVLCCGQGAVLIHSNQDDTRGGKRFTLADWLAGGPPRWSIQQLSAFIRRLADAVTGAADHQEVCGEYFGGARFVRGEASSYWVVVLPVTAQSVARP